MPILVFPSEVWAEQCALYSVTHSTGAEPSSVNVSVSAVLPVLTASPRHAWPGVSSSKANFCVATKVQSACGPEKVKLGEQQEGLGRPTSSHPPTFLFTFTFTAGQGLGYTRRLLRLPVMGKVQVKGRRWGTGTRALPQEPRPPPPAFLGLVTSSCWNVLLHGREGGNRELISSWPSRGHTTPPLFTRRLEEHGDCSLAMGHQRLARRGWKGQAGAALRRLWPLPSLAAQTFAIFLR